MSSTRDNGDFLLEIFPPSNRPAAATWQADRPLEAIVSMKNNSKQVIHITLTDPATDRDIPRSVAIASRHGYYHQRRQEARY
jgi:hypothetical protein